MKKAREIKKLTLDIPIGFTCTETMWDIPLWNIIRQNMVHEKEYYQCRLLTCESSSNYDTEYHGKPIVHHFLNFLLSNTMQVKI